MSSQTVLYLVIGVAVLGLLIVRQLRTRPVRGNERLILILGIIGLVEAVEYMQKLHTGSAAYVALIGSLVLAAIFGVARAATVRIWLENGVALAKGNVLTAVLWVAAVAAHLGYDYLIGQHKDIGNLGDATVVLYLAVSLAVQRVVTSMRANRLGASPASSVGARPF